MGGDISKQEVCSQFLRNWLNPIAHASGCAWLCVHHAGKPSTDKDARKGWTFTDWAYLGLGSSELVNWTRAAMILRQTEDGLFELRFAKRGRRAGAKHPDGTPTQIVYLQHDPEKIHWLQTDPPENPEADSDYTDDAETAKPRGKAGRKPEFDITNVNLYGFFQAMPKDGETKRQFAKRLEVFLANQKPPIARSENTIRKTDIPRLLECKKIRLITDQKGETRIIEGENA
ncbi:MAG: hypothetical protein ACP5T0_08755 [Verrucomicrobiia bacterium]